MATAKQKYPTTYSAPTSNVNILKGLKILQYPLDLGSTEKDGYGQENQFMMFRINTDSKTSALKDDAVVGSVVLAAGQRLGIGVGAAPRVNVFSKTDDSSLRIKFGDAAVSEQNFFVQKGMTRLDKVIVLPMPINHSLDTSIIYNHEYLSNDLTKLGDTLNNDIGSFLSDAVSDKKNGMMANFVNSFKPGATSKEALFAEDRLSTNPKKEVMYKEFGFRSFTFNYEFAPKSEKESDMVRDIIESLRYYALTEITSGKKYYIFPSEFEISFMLGQRDNPNIPKIGTCVLEAINVNYSPHQVWATLPNGAPVALTMTLRFLELELIDRSRIFDKESPIKSGY